MIRNLLVSTRKRLCPSISHAQIVTLKLKTQKIVGIMCECVRGGQGVWLGLGWGLEAPAQPSATIL